MNMEQLETIKSLLRMNPHNLLVIHRSCELTVIAGYKCCENELLFQIGVIGWRSKNYTPDSRDLDKNLSENDFDKAVLSTIGG